MQQDCDFIVWHLAQAQNFTESSTQCFIAVMCMLLSYNMNIYRMCNTVNLSIRHVLELAVFFNFYVKEK